MLDILGRLISIPLRWLARRIDKPIARKEALVCAQNDLILQTMREDGFTKERIQETDKEFKCAVKRIKGLS